VLYLAGPEAEALFFGAVGDGCDTTDNRMACEYLSEHYSEAELDRQLTRMRHAACTLVRYTRREIMIVAHALLRYSHWTMTHRRTVSHSSKP
jgi:hypothetical protein